jgi:hypothetical protein
VCPADWRVRFRVGHRAGWLAAQRVGVRACPLRRLG